MNSVPLLLLYQYFLKSLGGILHTCETEVLMTNIFFSLQYVLSQFALSTFEGSSHTSPKWFIGIKNNIKEIVI